MTVIALGLRIVIAVCAQILGYIEPAKPEPDLDPWEREFLAAKASHPSAYCIRCGAAHPKTGPCGRDN